MVLALAAACGGDAPAADAGSALTAPAAPAPEPEPRDDLLGTWYVFMPELPWSALRLDVRAETHGPRAAWISFDWSASPDDSKLSARSKPVATQLQGDQAQLVLEGPAPMLTENGQPNGQRGTWRIELHALPDSAARLAGRAWHTQITGPDGTPAELTREFRTAR